MILAEELDADWCLGAQRARLERSGLRRPALRHAPHRRLAARSRTAYTQYRELGARARAMLVGRGGRAVEGRRGHAAHAATASCSARAASKLGYGELAEAAMKLPVPEKVTLKDPKDFRIIGKPTARLDARAKTSGRQDFGIDMRLPGMLTAVVAHPPVFGARLKSVDDSAAQAPIKGVKAVLRVPVDRGGEGVAVVADGYWPAKQGRDALKLAVGHERASRRSTATSSWRSTASWPTSPARASSTPTCRRWPARRSKIEAEFVFPYLAHAPMEPLNCTVQPGRRQRRAVGRHAVPGPGRLAAAARCWACTPEQVKMHVQMAGGGFGRRVVGYQRLRGRGLRASPRPRRPRASTRRSARCGAARTTSRAATTARCTCTARSIGFDAQRQRARPGTTSSSASPSSRARLFEPSSGQERHRRHRHRGHARSPTRCRCA